MTRRHRLIALGVAVLVVIVVAVLSVTTSPRGTSRPTSATSALVGRHVSTFTLSGLDGGRVHAPWASHRASVLIFFASYCGPCQGEMPKVARYLRSHDPSPVEVVGVDAIDVRSSAQAMVRRDGVTFPIAFDPSGTVTHGVFGFGQIPESVFVSAAGVVRKVYYGAIPQRQLADGIAALRRSTA